MSMSPVLSAHGINKSFFGNTVLHGIDFELLPGQVHGLVGENGAGKSTLMKIFAGVHRPDTGAIKVGSEVVDFDHPVQATNAGIVTIFQEFNLLPDRTIAENVFLGRELRGKVFISRRDMQRQTADLLSQLEVNHLDPSRLVGSLSVAEQQVVEIVKALSFEAQVIQMDEPTAALAEHEVELLYRIVRRLQAQGVGVIYVSHRLKEIFDLCDRVTVLKDGALVHSSPATDLGTDELVRLMVGRSISAYYPAALPGTEVGEPRLTISGGGNEYVDDVNLSVRRGEIIGIAGLQGSGRTELAEAIFGALPFTRGQVQIDGEMMRCNSTRRAIKAGIALVTEDRKQQGLALGQSIRDNLMGVVHAVFARNSYTARRTVPQMLSELEVNTRDADMEVQYLSGGNQQKVVLGKWMSAFQPARPLRVLILDEPTRGIDVGAKVAVYQLMRQLAHNGVAIVMISSELPEIISLADRILVMRDGRVAGELPAGAAEEEILRLATGHVTTHSDSAEMGVAHG